MSRATSNQLKAHSFVTPIRQADGSFRSVLSSQMLSNQSVCMSSKDCCGAMYLLMMLMQSQSVNPNPLIRDITRIAPLIRKIPPEILIAILGYLVPINNSEELITINAYATATRIPRLFQDRKTNPAFVVDAAMRGQEIIVLNMLNIDLSYLLKRAVVKNSVGVAYEVTPLQAAIMSNDVQLVERMKTYFERIPHGLTIMYAQMIEIYQKSLQRYYDKQQVLQNDLNPKCKDQNYLNTLIAKHSQAEKNNTFNFQCYVDVICRIDPNSSELQNVLTLIDATTGAEMQAAIAKGVSSTEIDFTDDNGIIHTREEVQALLFDQLTLMQKLNRFREKLTEHMQQEIIFNPNHILESMKQHGRAWNEVQMHRIADPNNCAKRRVLFSQLVGFAQRQASEPVKQDIRQGIWSLIYENKLRTRQNRFNTDLTVRNALVDVSLFNPSAIDGIGYKFGVGGSLCGVGGEFIGAVDGNFFSELLLHKQRKLKDMLAELVQVLATKVESSHGFCCK